MNHYRNTKKKCPRILVLSSFSHSLINFRKEMLESFVEHGCDVHAVGPEMADTTRDQLAAMQCSPQEIELSRTGLNPIRDIATCWRLFRLFRKVKPDIVFSYTMKPVVYGTLAAWLAGIPKRVVLITGLGISFNFSGKGLKGWLLRGARTLIKLGVGRSNLVIFQNPDDRALFQTQGFLRNQQVAIVNGSGVNLEHFEKTELPNDPVFLVVARLVVEKGIREFIDAVQVVKKQLPQSRFQLVSQLETGPSAISKTELDRWVADGDVEYLGVFDDIRPAYRAASIFVLPSYREGTPRTILEAMAMGRPVITCDTPGCRETVEPNQNGLLVSPRSSSELADAMLKLGHDPSLRQKMGDRGREIAEEKYDVHKVNAVINGLLGIN